MLKHNRSTVLHDDEQYYGSFQIVMKLGNKDDFYFLVTNNYLRCSSQSIRSF